MSGALRKKTAVFGRPYKVTAHMLTPIAGEPPQLDALVIYAQSRRHECDRARPAPPQEKGCIPLRRDWVDGWLVSRTSSPIYVANSETVDYYHRQFPVNHSDKLRKDRQLVVATGNSWTKSYRLPLRNRAIQDVVWFVVGNGASLRKVLDRIPAIGKKTSMGYGVVQRWSVVPVEDDYSWFVPADGKRVLMRPLPLSLMADDVVGFRRDFGACVPPMWHPSRYTEIVVPC